MLKKILFTIFSLNLTLLPLKNVLAVETQEDISTASATTDTEAEDSLQERIKNTVQENLDEAEDSIRQKLEQKLLLGYTGTITSIKENIITANTNNNLYQIIFDEDTVVVRKGSNIDPEDLAIDEDIIIMGYLSTDDILTARRIVTTNLTPNTSFRQTFIGTLQEIDSDNDSLILLVDNQPLNIDIEDYDFDQESLPQPQQQLMLIVDTDSEDNTYELLQLQIL